MKKKPAIIKFWDNEVCEFCDSPIRARKIDLPRNFRGKLVLLKNIPAGVCTGCGKRYFAANVLKIIEATLRRKQKAKRQIKVPVFSLNF